jgi:large subunit ribosomal protein L29
MATKMQAQELVTLPTEELQKKLDDAYRELFNLRFQRAQNQLKDMNTITRVRRDIARLRTVMRQRELAREVQSAAQAPGGQA